ncbi:e5d116fe-8e6a-4eff-85a8-5ff407c4962d [Thermothielavioides terrestris]|uniref:E5d116fe-8e6a-4eff-85a8-5ff407c4962d n=1 Tax=Thermothielavioides terrestris TaxID=2587410 RepID=A0A446BVK4_9PEZI|nr:e5d116fe-8e6a-4eff-85a8-5ff407c4962d [Thermothielavioides terrestris]
MAQTAIGCDENRDEAKRARKRLQRLLRPHHLRLRETLGWGGNGIAGLYYHTRQDRTREYFVAKYSIRPDPSYTEALMQEKDQLEIYQGALHIVQLKEPSFPLSPPPCPDTDVSDGDEEESDSDKKSASREKSDSQKNPEKKGPPPAAPGAPAQPPPPNDVLFLEYLGRGNLHKLILAVNPWISAHNPAAGVIQMCIALEYPPGLDMGLDPPMDIDGTVNGEYVSERIFDNVVPEADNEAGGSEGHDADDSADDDSEADNEAEALEDHGADNSAGGGSGAGSQPEPFPGMGMVHFDIDPLNIFVGNLNTGPAHDRHARVPVLKLGDFGSAHEIDDQVLSDEEKIWKLRRAGKVQYKTPEQFTEEWDWMIGRFDEASLVRKTAGKYGWHTNLYQLALVMACLITLRYPLNPPRADPITIRDPADPRREIEVMSYGAYLLGRRFAHVDAKLRRLVAQCLCDEPAHRPRLAALQAAVARELDPSRVWEGRDADAEVDQWVRDNIAAPPAGPPQPRHWVDRN